MRELPGSSLTETLATHLRERELLLLLDNFEQVLDAAPLVHDLFTAAPGLTVLVTSRVALHIGGEHAYVVPPLDAPDHDHLPSLDALAANPAVALFLQRARAVRSDVTLTEANAAAVARVCVRLDGLPLALELGAARLRALSIEGLDARLDDRFRLLTGGDRAASPRQQTLRATIDWSYDLLSTGERTLLHRLAVFTGGWTLKAAEALCAGGGIEQADVLDLLDALVERSLVIVRNEGGDVRYRLLGTLREYALERLESSDEAETIRHRHAHLLLGMAEDAEPHLKRADRSRWVAWLETEYDNLRAALSWLLTAGEAETGVRLAAALVPFWSERGHLSEGRGWLQRALAVGGPGLPASVRAKALSGAGMLAMLQMDIPAACANFEESLTLWRMTATPQGAADVLSMLAHAVHLEGDIAAMLALSEESLTLYRELSDYRGMAGSLGQLGHAAWHQQQFPRARVLLTDALALLRELEQGWAIWNPFMSVTHVLWSLGNVARDQGDHATARARYTEAMAAAQDQGSAFHVAALLDSFASLAVAEGHAVRAGRLLGAAEAVRTASGLALVPVYRRDFYDAIIATVQAALTAPTLTTAWAEGRAMSWEQAIGYSATRPEDVPVPLNPANGGGRAEADGGTVYPDRLTAREVEVLCLLAGGKSNPAIAEALVLSVHTVERHVANIYAKIGSHTRVEATAYALRRSLV